MVNGPQYSIYQKRDAKIEQTQGPDQHQTYISYFDIFTVSQ